MGGSGRGGTGAGLLLLLLYAKVLGGRGLGGGASPPGANLAGFSG